MNQEAQSSTRQIMFSQRGLIISGIILFLALIYLLSDVLTPFLIAGLLAYLGDPLVNRLTRYKIPRTLAAVIVFLILLMSIILLLFLIVPLIQKQIALLIERLPQAINWVQLSAIPWIESNFNITLNLDLNTLKTALTGHWEQASNVAQYMFKTLHESGLVLVKFVINLVLIPVVNFYLLRDWDKVVIKTKQLFPPNILPKVSHLFNECNEVVGAFFRGQLLVMLVLGFYFSIGLKIVGLDFALLIGVIIGVLSIVPYLGSMTGLVIAVLATYFQFQDIKHLIFTLIVFLLGHLLEGMILTPLLIGDRIGLHPVAVIFAVLAGGQLFGFVGVLLALPVAAIIMVLIRHIHSYYLQSDFYKKSTVSDVINIKP